MSGGEHVTVHTFRTDPMFPSVERAALAILANSKVVTPVGVMVGMGWLSSANLDAWRKGRVLYLERVIQCNLTHLGRFLRILSFACHELNLVGTPTEPPRRARGRSSAQRFTKTGEPRLEAAYARRYIWPGKGPFHLPRRRQPEDDGEGWVSAADGLRSPVQD